MNMISLVSEYYPLYHHNANNWRIAKDGEPLDSLVIFGNTNSWYRYSTQQSGGPKQFLTQIIGLSYSEANDIVGEDEDNTLLKFQSPTAHEHHTGLSLRDVCGEPGYNKYINSRMISEDTAKYFGLEVDFVGNVYIPLYDTQKRIGSLMRRTDTNEKHLKYRFLMCDGFVRPFCFDMPLLQERNGNSIVVLVEGCWSLMRIHQVVKPLYPNLLPIATIGTNLTEDLYSYIYDLPIYAILDDDEGGKTYTEQLNQWRNRGANIEILQPKDSRGFSIYPDDLTDKQLKTLFNTIMQPKKFSF